VISHGLRDLLNTLYKRAIDPILNPISLYQVAILYNFEWLDDGGIMNWVGFGRKAQYYLGIRLEGLSKIM
jgi:hypothetical protein